MDNSDRLLALWNTGGLRSEGIGPDAEWDPVDSAEFQVRHTAFWNSVTRIIQSEPGGYEQLPTWMTETAAEELHDN